MTPSNHHAENSRFSLPQSPLTKASVKSGGRPLRLGAVLLALLLCRVRSIRQPLWPALYGAFALTGNAVSGRVTFGVGVLFGLAAVAVICVWPDRLRTTRPEHRVPRAILAALLSALATAASPVAGLFVGVVAAALWLEGRRAAAYVDISKYVGPVKSFELAA